MTPAVAASAETGMLRRTGAIPGELASTTIGSIEEDPSAPLAPFANNDDDDDDDDGDLGALNGPSRSMARRSERWCASMAAVEVVRTTALTRPWYAGKVGSLLARRACGSPLCVPWIRPGPLTIRKVTRFEARCFTWPAASRIEARTRAASCPSRSNEFPVPVRLEGASRVRAMEAVALFVRREVFATGLPAASLAMTVMIPDSHSTLVHSA
mmetsp:Transcript_25733/g.49907  ORF Transcript_25733/g.49907 Transcript_25733/m.49907 type:complete len:212 (+) Transcript_25733:647-1282(+)